MANLQDTTINDTGFISLPTGNDTTERPGNTAGRMRYNATRNLLEFFDGNQWRQVTGYSAGAIGTGGQSITYGNGGIVHMFTTVGNHTFTPAFTGNIQVLVVGGGGGAGFDWAGGGGGGGVVYNRAFPVTNGSAITVTVGDGRGSLFGPGWSTGAEPGLNSVFGSITANGGGGSGCWGHPPSGLAFSSWEGRPGGSGGGGGNTGDGTDSRQRVRGGDGTTGQGFPGGAGVRFNTSDDNGHHGGGGGGAGGPGMSAPDERQSSLDNLRGGPGAATDILGTTLYFGGGGAGGSHIGAGVSYNNGGIGGGGGGGIYHGAPRFPGDARQGQGGGFSLNTGQPSAAHRNRADGGQGGANTGGGAGGGQWGNKGGSGVVIVRY